MAVRPNFNGYDVGGSYFRYLLDTFGAKKTKKYYTGMKAKKAFGKSLEQVEAGWHKRLDRVKIRPGLETLLKKRRGETASFTRYVPGNRVLDVGREDEWESLIEEPIEDNEIGTWKRSGQKLRGTGKPDEGNWALCTLGEDVFGDCLVRATVKSVGGCWGVQIQLGHGCQAIVLGNGAFLYNDVGGIAHNGDVALGSSSIDIVLQREGGTASVWVDGTFVFEGQVKAEKSSVGVGVVQGTAEFTDIAVRPLDD